MHIIIGILRNCYNSGDITLYDFSESEYRDYIGSLAIYNYEGTIENCYTSGKIKDYNTNSIVGAIIAYEEYGTIINTYYLSGTSKYVIAKENSTSASLTGKTEQELKGLSSTLGSMWTINANINNGYPILTWQK